MLKSIKPLLNYKRPLQARIIPLKYRSYRGKIRSTKIHLQNTSFDFESGLERDLIEILDHDYFCYDIQAQPSINENNTAFFWSDKDGIRHKSFPDLWSIFITNKIILWQVKSYKDLKKLKEKHLWNQEIEALKLECNRRGWELKIVTELDLRNVRLSNIKILRGAALHPPDEQNMSEIYTILKNELGNGVGKTFSELKKKCLGISNTMNQIVVQHVLLYFLYYQILSFNWKELLQKHTLIYLNLNQDMFLQPFYKERPLKEYDLKESIESTPYYNPDSIKNAYNRYNIIKPLLENSDRKRIDVERRAKQFKYSPEILYRWIRNYQIKGGINGLLPTHERKGNRGSRYPGQVEKVISNSIEFYCSRVNKPSIKSLVLDIQQKVQEIGYDPEIIKYHSIAKRIRKLPANEKFGKQGKFTRYEIPSSVQGSMAVGKYPLDVIQLDHTLLDIVLVDQVFRLPIGRPWITLGIDTFSRMVYCYFISLNNPNSVSVATALMMGILPKEDLLNKYGMEGTYPIFGLPRKISVDNAKEFDSGHLEEFCQIFHIDKQFREVKRPDHAPFVERFFGTLNRSIRDSDIKGYAHPLKDRPDNYNPDKEAEKGGLSLPEFETWVLRWITNVYHQRNHSSLGSSPQEKYQLGLIGEGESFGGILENPETTKLKFLIMPKWNKKAVVGKEGIRWKHNYYQHNEYKEIHPIIRNIRKRNRGKKVKIEFRYDPRDITYIWIFDPITKKYYPIFISKGFLKQFVVKYVGRSISLSEYEAIIKKTHKEKIKIDSKSVFEGLEKNRVLVEESAEKSKRARRKLAKKAEDKRNVTEIQEVEDKKSTNDMQDDVKIDWKTIKPIRKRKMAKPIEKN